jgi:hypothetical protein
MSSNFTVTPIFNYVPSQYKKEAYEITFLSVCPPYQLLNESVIFMKFCRKVMPLVLWRHIL